MKSPEESIPDTETLQVSPERSLHAAGGFRRFTPGTVLVDRYRVVSLVGAGGMGEVYRADDMKLGQSVALKFLPRRAGAQRQQLFHEVKLGRQVAHPNVCRLYDIIETDDDAFITMEYVDGEDLSSLLRRIGRLPAEKALRVAHDLCSGLAAAHERGVIHRDLKPSNIMIDSRGTAKITDFGLAAVTDDAADLAVAGTPGYMAPEQLSGGPLSARTDLYALGLILHELFTGQRLFAATSLEELVAAHRRKKPRPSTLVPEIHPAIDRLVLECLNEEPRLRPASADDVRAMLPGGDAIAAALATGDTPPPEIVAQAGASGQIDRRRAWLLLVVSAVGVFIVLALVPATALHQHVPLAKSPDVLEVRARDILKELGYDAAHGVSWLERNDSYLLWLAEHDRSPGIWRQLARTPPSAIDFAFAAVPRSYSAVNTTGRIQYEPPIVLEQFPRVRLAGNGTLTEFRAPVRHSSGMPSWPTLFAAAGLKQDEFLGPSVKTTAGAAELRWSRRSTSIPLHVHAAVARDGSLQSFSVSGPWAMSQSVPSRFAAQMGLSSPWTRGGLMGALLLSAIVAGLLARRNILRRRVDRSGAAKIALYVLFVQLVAWAFTADHHSDLAGEWDLVMTAMSTATLNAGLIWLLYLGLEPAVRKRWPLALVSWMRLLFGRIHDARVGRDLLIGVIAALTFNILWRLTNIAPRWFGEAPLIPYGSNWDAFVSLRGTAGRFFALQTTAILFSLCALMFLLFWRIVTQHDGISIALTAGTIAVATYGSVGWHASRPGQIAFVLVYEILIGAGAVLLALRVGVLSLAVALFIHFGLCAHPLTTDMSSWYAGRSAGAVLLILTLAAYGAVTAVGRPGLIALPED